MTIQPPVPAPPHGDLPSPRLRVLVVILSLDREPWRTLEAAQRDTWAGPHVVHAIAEVDIVHLRGISRGGARAAFLGARRAAECLGLRHSFDVTAGRWAIRFPATIKNGILKTRTFEYWIGTSVKTHSGLRYLAAHEDFNYLVRTNSSTYLDIPTLLRHLDQAPRENYYAGADQGEAHAQGTLIILSRDLVMRLAADGQWDYGTVDDAALGAAVRRAGSPFKALPQHVVQDVTEGVADLELSKRSGDFIYRFKNRADRVADAKAMRELHEYFVRARPTK